MKSPSQIPVSLLFLLIVIAITNGLAGVNSWFWIYRWFDMPMHFAGGMWLAGMGLWWVYFKNGVEPEGFLHTFAIAVLFAFSIGFLWEAYEAMVSYYTVGYMNNILDTLSDLLFDILGSIAVAILVYKRELFKTQN